MKGKDKGGNKFIQHVCGEMIDPGCCRSSTPGGKGQAEGVGVFSVIQWSPDADAESGITVVGDDRMCGVLLLLSLQVGKDTGCSSGPGRVGKMVNTIFVAWIDGSLGKSYGHILIEPLV